MPPLRRTIAKGLARAPRKADTPEQALRETERMLDRVSGPGLTALRAFVPGAGIYGSTSGGSSNNKTTGGDGSHIIRRLSSGDTLRHEDRTLIADTTGGDFTVTLATAGEGAFCWVKNTGPGILTISAAAGEGLLSGTVASATFTVGSGDDFTFFSDGLITWHVA